MPPCHWICHPKKTVKFGILYIVITCLVSKSSYFMFDVPKSKKTTFDILCMHLYAYILLSPKVIVFNFFQNCDSGHIGFRGLDGLKFKKYNSSRFVIAKIVELDLLCIFIAYLVPELSNLKFFKMAIRSHFLC